MAKDSKLIVLTATKNNNAKAYPNRYDTFYPTPKPSKIREYYYIKQITDAAIMIFIQILKQFSSHNHD